MEGDRLFVVLYDDTVPGNISTVEMSRTYKRGTHDNSFINRAVTEINRKLQSLNSKRQLLDITETVQNQLDDIRISDID